MVKHRHRSIWLCSSLLLGGCLGGAQKEVDEEMAKHPEYAEYAPFTDSRTLSELNSAYQKLIEEGSSAASIRPRTLMTVLAQETLPPEQGPEVAKRFGFSYKPAMLVITLYTPQGWLVMPAPAGLTLLAGQVVEVDMPSANDIAQLASSDEVRSQLLKLVDNGTVGVVTPSPQCRGEKYMEAGYTVTCNGQLASYIGNEAVFPAGALRWLTMRSKQGVDDGSADWVDKPEPSPAPIAMHPKRPVPLT